MGEVGADRRDNMQGHLSHNLLPSCSFCNKARNNHFTVDEMIIIGMAIRKIRIAREDAVLDEEKLEDMQSSYFRNANVT